jgi:hypothetical protein
MARFYELMSDEFWHLNEYHEYFSGRLTNRASPKYGG